jgi:hypothetical protein
MVLFQDPASNMFTIADNTGEGDIILKWGAVVMFQWKISSLSQQFITTETFGWLRASIQDRLSFNNTGLVIGFVDQQELVSSSNIGS